MSFYGDITNTSRTHFQFDRIYANRVEMDNCKDTDGIYTGRFVLVEYNNETHMDSYLRVRKDKNNFYTTFSDKTSQETLLTKNNIQIGTIVYESAYETSPDNGYYAKNCIFYKCVGYDTNDIALFEDVVGLGEEDPHVTNYTIDFRKYGRGYDSTVWQKVYDGGIEKYIMVAELNTVIPTFDLQQDAPTQTPIVPHFDIQGSDIYYKLHQQPQWGFRVKSAKIEEGPQFDQGKILNNLDTTLYTTSYPAEPYQSDETTEWVRHEYNPNTGHISTLYWHSGNTETTQQPGSWQSTPPTNKLPAAIYYNKDGFDPEVITKSTLEDHILVEGSGVSGQLYSSHDAVGTESVYPDIQELSMMLPSIGNSISSMWDLIYGNENMSTEETDDGRKKRNLDIDWNSTKGLRMVTNKESGFDYNTKQVSTLAGAINSVHDLMGMIILAPSEPMSEDFAKKAENNKIYYYDGDYYHRVNDYVYDENESISAEPKSVGFLTKEEFDPNIHYRFNENTKEYERVSIYIDDIEYFICDRILTPDEIAEISYKTLKDKFGDTFTDFKKFPPEDDYFYYGTLGEFYQLETENHPTYNRVYYATSDKTPFFTHVTPVEFDKNIHYRFVSNDEIDKYEDENGEIVTVQLGYYINDDTMPNEQSTYYELQENDIAIIDSKFRPYVPNTYYIYNAEGKIGAEIGSLEDTKVELKDIEISKEPYNEEYNYYTATIYQGELYLEKAYVFGVTKNHYYQNLNGDGSYHRCSQGFIPQQDLVLNNLSDYRFVVIPDKNPVDYFYIPNKYYILEDDTNKYKIYKEKNWDKNISLYLRTSDNNIRIVDLVEEQYYVSNTYYYKYPGSGKMVIDRNKTATDSNKPYYFRDKILYVFKDENNIMRIGMEWNEKVTTIPAGITLATRKEKPVMRKLEGFARELNTIHGLILEINRILLTNDAHTRDPYTVQGVINIINDIIDKFEIIAPGQFVIIDDYGRVHSAPHTTAQAFTAHNYGNNENIEDIEIENRWITLEIDSKATNPKIAIKHNFTNIENPNTDTTSDHNEINSSGKIKLYTPIVDTMGHIVGKNIETVELPHSFKTIKVGNTPIIANNHIASINIANEDKWIRVNANANTDTLIINHIGPASGGTTTYSKNDTPKFGASFNIPTITYDSKGHISESSNHTVTLPTLSLIDNSSGNVLTGLTLDITTDTTGKLTLTKESIGTLALGETYSIAKSASAITNTDTLNTALGKLEYKVNRNVGSLTLGTYKKNDDANTAITSADSIQLALRKLENRIKALEKK